MVQKELKQRRIFCSPKNLHIVDMQVTVSNIFFLIDMTKGGKGGAIVKSGRTLTIFFLNFLVTIFNNLHTEIFYDDN